MDFLLLALLVAAIPFILPIASWVSARRTRRLVEELAGSIDEQGRTIEALKAQVTQLRRQAAEAPVMPAEDRRPAAPAPAVARQPVPPVVAPPPAAVPPSTAGGRETGASRPRCRARTGRSSRVPLRVPAELPVPPAPSVPPAAPAPMAASAQAGAAVPHTAAAPPPRPPRVPPPTVPPEPPKPAFDWESLVGVKLFSAIAGIALVFAAVFFLKYSVEHGWLQPKVRVVIGITVALALLVVCELKAARKYPSTANALDAAAIAILFSTFFAAHALWNLIPSAVAFILLGVVTAIAVLLSIRRESLFIAVLGLLGGFATPILLSTGENKPIPLFAYLTLLNIGLAWVAYRKTWPVLTTMTLVFTTIYQWGWVFKFLDRSQLPLAMAIFLLFPLTSLTGLILAKRRMTGDAPGPDRTFERTAMFAAVVPLLFAVYVSAAPEYGDRPGLLFGFLLLIDAGLLAVSLARRQGLLHAAGAVTTVVVMASWLALSYTPAGPMTALVFAAVFVTFFALAPAIAERLGRALEGEGDRAVFAAPILLFVPAALARFEPAIASPLVLFGTVLALVLLIAWRAMVTGRGPLYFWAAFFAVATQASWSSAHLTIELLGTAVLIYTVFGIVATAIPIAARRAGRPLQPEWGSGAVLIASLALLLFLSLGSIAPAALWALALLLAIINAGLFVESAAGGLPLVSVVGSLFSWLVLAIWWIRAGSAVGVLPSLAVLTGLSLMTLGGHAWASLRSQKTGAGPGISFHEGMYLGLIGHLFVLLIAVTANVSSAPWPWLATLAVLTLATSAVSLITRAPALHAGGVIAAGLVISVWTNVTGATWGFVPLAAAAGVSAFALAWIAIARNNVSAVAAATVLFLGELTAINATAGSGSPPFPAIVVAHVANLATLLALTWTYRWRHVALWTVLPACFAAAAQWGDGDLRAGWMRLLVLAFAMYAVFTAYPIAVGRRGRGERDPYLAAVLASVMFFFAARAALVAGGYNWMVGVLPVFEGAVMALLLRQLLQIEPAGERDLGRLALVAGSALAFVTVAIPLQLRHQWITIGWALEGMALAWLYRKIPHRGLLYSALGLLGAVFVRLAMNPEVLIYEPRGDLRIFNWYLYAYVICAAAFLVAAWWLSRTDDRIGWLPVRPSQILPAGAVVLLFMVLNIEIADFYATGPSIMFRFGVSLSQDLTYTIGWLIFGMVLLAVCIYLHNRVGRVAALAPRGRHDVQVFHVRPELSRGSVPRGLARRAGLVAGAHRGGDAEIRPGAAGGSRVRAAAYTGTGRCTPDRRRASRAAGAAGSLSFRAADRDGRGGSAASGHRRAAPGRSRARVPRPADVRSSRRSGAVPAAAVAGAGAAVEQRDAAAAGGHGKDERVRGGFSRRQYDRRRPRGRAAGAVSQAARARGQRRPRALDAARRPGDAVRSPRGRPAPDGSAILTGGFPIRAGDVGRHQQRARADAGRSRCAAGCRDCPAAAADRRAPDGVPAQRAGEKPLPHQAAGGAAADRGG